MRKHAIVAALILTCAAGLFGADLNVPQSATAGTAITIGTAGEGTATFYLIGPVARAKLPVQLGQPVQIRPEDTRAAGLYTAILRSDSGTIAKSFFVVPSQPGHISFLAQPSRVPTSASDAISGTAFVMDDDYNLVLAPAPVEFALTPENSPVLSRTVNTRDGVAWTRIDSGARSGSAQFTASAGNVSVKRIVYEVAAQPCNLRFHAQPSHNGILVETDPVRDCAGNPVPDGTIVTFTGMDSQGKSTVDAVVKKGVARAELPAASQATISVASGVVSGNEIRWEGHQ